MILRRYGQHVHSVEANFDSKALNEVGFRRDHKVDLETEEFRSGYVKLSEHSLVAEAEGYVQDEVEGVMLADLLAQLTALDDGLEETQVLFVESESGKDYPRTKTRQKNVIVQGENRLHFFSSIDPPLRIGVYRES